jgi:hypothetical protein
MVPAPLAPDAPGVVTGEPNEHPAINTKATQASAIIRCRAYWDMAQP